ncbi:hypothetical protein GCM10010390_66180 [Streptomyces mordarskii]|uniref:Uncharacterized protein n=1 Tax=Streptomyces mordarskii TaxID=1226758 RepID=A0ABN1DY26_9ACTN
MPNARDRLGEFIGCSNVRCRNGEWTTKAAERGWVRNGDAWVCPQHKTTAHKQPTP